MGGQNSGRKKKSFREMTTDMPDWADRLYEVMSYGRPARTAFTALGLSYRSHARFMKEEPEYQEAMMEGMVACEQFYVEMGIKGLTDKSMSVGHLVWMTKNILHWKDTQDSGRKDRKNIDEVEEEKQITTRYGGELEEGKVTPKLVQ